MLELLEELEEIFPEKINKIKSILESLEDEINDIMDEINDKINDSYNNRDFSNIVKYIRCAESLSFYETKLGELIEKTTDDLNEIVEDIELSETDVLTEEEVSYKISYREYNIQDHIFGKKLVGFSFLTDSMIKINGWQDLFQKVCEILIDIDDEKIRNFQNMPEMNGNSRIYFSENQYILKKPIKLKNNISIETNLSASQIRNIIINMLKEYRFNSDDFMVYEETILL